VLENQGSAIKSASMRSAKGSAMESGAVLDILYCLKFIQNSEYREIKTLLHRVISMLAKLCFNLAYEK
jgi:four helix bundle protein